MTAEKKTLTNDFGAPVPENEHALSAGERGPLLLQDGSRVAQALGLAG